MDVWLKHPQNYIKRRIPMENIQFCPNCGKKLSGIMAFCANCGFRLSASSEESRQEMGSQEKKVNSAIFTKTTPVMTSLSEKQDQQNSTTNVDSSNTVSPQIIYPTTPLPELIMEFRGSGLKYFFIFLWTSVASILSFGLFQPWAYVIQQRWIASNTYINNQQITFHGTGTELLLKYIMNMLLILLTLGLYLPWATCQIKKWTLERTRLASSTR